METDWRNSGLPFSPLDIVLWEKAARDIASERCGSLLLRVVDEVGRPLRGVPISYQQTAQRWRLGVHYPYDPQAYERLQAAGVNAAALWLGWAHVQPQRGHFDWSQLERVWQPAALHRMGLRLTAEALLWFKTDWPVLPEYVQHTPQADLPALVYEHIQHIARRWGAYLETYQILNEPFWESADALALKLPDMVRVCHAAALAVRDVAPKARLEVSFAETSRIPSYRVRPFDLLDALDSAGVPYDVIGLQAFENAYALQPETTYFRCKTFAGQIQTLRQYAVRGKPIRISALAVPSTNPDGRVPSRFKPVYGPWSEDAQAHYLDAAYTLFFAQRGVEGVTWACPVDGRLAYIHTGGLLRQNLAPKPAYHALQQWTERHSSSGALHSDAEGKATVRGYAGSYEISVGVGDLGRSLHQEIEPAGSQEQLVVLAYHP